MRQQTKEATTIPPVRLKHPHKQEFEFVRQCDPIMRAVLLDVTIYMHYRWGVSVIVTDLVRSGDGSSSHNMTEDTYCRAVDIRTHHWTKEMINDCQRYINTVWNRSMLATGPVPLVHMRYHTTDGTTEDKPGTGWHLHLNVNRGYATPRTAYASPDYR